jgi:hypothetical protein
MDGCQFDHWTRRFAARRTRRSTLGAAAVTLASAAFGGAFANATAQQAGLPLGAPCATADQCSQAGGPVACADNGLTRDGSLNCCRSAGGACGADNECCAGLDCVNGACGAASTAQSASQSAGQTAGQSVAGSGGFALGAPCTDSSQCAASGAGTAICGDSRVDRDRTRTCCLQDGGACGANDAVCCGSSTCNQGVCGAPQFGNLGPGDACQATTDCSQALGPAICAAKATAGGAARCCLRAAANCSTDDECCDSLVCAENGIASDGGRNCCGQSGTACDADADCCAYLFCMDGACGPIG